MKQTLRSCLVCRKGKRGKEWNREEERRMEWRKVVKLDFIIWFDIKFNKEL